MSKRRDKQSNEKSEDDVKMNKKEEEIAKYIRFNCPTSTTLFEGNEVHYFSGSKAVDTLWDSKYGSKAKSDPMFKTRDECFHYIADLFSKQLFFRARKLVAKKKEDKGNESAGDVPKSPKKGVLKRKDNKSKEDDTVTETEAEDKKKEEEEKEQKSEKDEKKKRKVKLLVHSIQVFVDDKDVYVWVFDPTPLYKKVIGVLMLLGTIVGCLFPLWPTWLRQGVYYISLGGIGVFASIIVVAILRTILFAIIYAATLGKHKLWILPNLTEDCGVLESFQPWYTYEYCGGADKKDSKKKKRSKKEKDSDVEEEKPDENGDAKEDAEKFSQESSDENYEKIDAEENSELSEVNSSSPPSPNDGAIRKRRPVKA